MGLYGPEVKGKDTFFPLFVTNKPKLVSEMGTLERDGGRTARDIGTMFVSDGGGAVKATILPGSNKLIGTEDRGGAVAGGLSIIWRQESTIILSLSIRPSSGYPSIK